MILTSRYLPPKLADAIVAAKNGIRWQIGIYKTFGDGATFLALQNSVLKTIASKLPNKDITVVGQRWNGGEEAFIASGTLEDGRYLLYGFYVHRYPEMITVVWTDKEILVIGEYNSEINHFVKVEEKEIPEEYMQIASFAMKKLNKNLHSLYLDRARGDLLVIDGYSSCF